MLLFLYLSVLSINMLVFKCEEMCKCQEIDLLKDIIQQVMLEQKLESAKLRKLEARQRSSSAGSPSAIFVDRLVKMEAKIADIDKTLNDIVQEKPEDKSENMEIILKKALASEKLERVQFVSDIESQMTDMKETFEQFKIESNSIIGESIGNISATEKEMKENINEKFKEIKGQTDNLVRKVQTNEATLKDDLKSEVNEKLEDINNLNQLLNDVDKKITTLNNIAVKDKIDGGWTHWGAPSAWSSCSVSCGSGLRYKSRTCSSPSPSVLGRQCEGNSRWTNTCGSRRCPGQRVAFTAYGIQAGSSNSEVTFPNIIMKIGNNYSLTTGKFTCSIPGIYHFVLTLSMKNSKDNDDIRCYIYLNSISQVELYANKHDHDSTNSFPATAAVVLHLNRGDTVYVGSCDEYDKIYDDRSTNFMGFLVSADE